MEQISVTKAREAAFFALKACEKQGAWSDQAMKSASKKFALDTKDAGLAANLCYGVVQNELLLDFWIDAFSKIPANKLKPEVRTSLRLGLYQLAFLDRVPASAAVNESVNLVRKYVRNRGASGLTNAVLRAFQRAGENRPQPAAKDRLEQLSIRYSHPRQLVELLEQALGGDAEALLAADNTPAELVVQVNTLLTDTDSLRRELEASGVTVEAHPWLADCLFLKKTGDLEQLEAFRAGKCYVQDSAAKLAVLAADPKPGQRLLDACAAPGGKSFASAIRMAGQGAILSCDVQEKKLGRLEAGAHRLGISCIQTAQADGKVFRPEWADAFDVVLTDVPCSGLGIIRKKPDIRYKNLQQIEALPAIQLDILKNAARYVKPGGTLLYSTCTVLERENEGVVRAFLGGCSDFKPEPFALPEPIGQTGGWVTLWPHIHGTDGFFVAKLRKTNG